jgi:hypothetical protein
LVLWLWLGLARSTQMHAEIADDADAALCHLFFLYTRIVFYTIMYNIRPIYSYIFFLLFPLFRDSLHSIMVLTGVDLDLFLIKLWASTLILTLCFIRLFNKALFLPEKKTMNT